MRNFLRIYVTFEIKASWDGFFAHCILSSLERKGLKYFSCTANTYVVRGRFYSFSAQEECAEWYFSGGQAKNFNCILFSWGSDIISRLPRLKYWPYGVLISCWKIFAHSPITLNKAKVREKKLKSLLSILNTMGWSKKPTHATVP